MAVHLPWQQKNNVGKLGILKKYTIGKRELTWTVHIHAAFPFIGSKNLPTVSALIERHSRIESHVD